MAIIDDLKSVIYNPNLVQNTVLEQITNITNGDINIPDPTNPFIYLLENHAMVTSASMQEVASATRKMYPQLALTKEDLYHHLADSELEDIFASPSYGSFKFYINKNDMVRYGYNTELYTEILIPKLTNINVADTNFLLLNDIVIRLYKSNKLYVKLLGNDYELGVPYDKLLDSTLVTDNNYIQWIMFDIDIKQLSYNSISDTIIEAKPFHKEIIIDNQYALIDVSAFSPTLNNMLKLNRSYSNFVYNPSTPTVYVKPTDNKIILDLPVYYTINNTISGNIDMEIFTTKGVLELSLTDYKTGDYKITYGDLTDIRSTGLKNMSIYASGSGFTYGGRNDVTFDELKQIVMYHSTGDNVLPITIDEIKEELDELGYDVKLNIDSILEREYVVTKEIDNLGYDIKALGDVYIDKIKIYPDNIDNDKIKLYDKSLVVNPGNTFELNDDGSISIITNDISIDTSDKDSLLAISDKKYFYNIYKYIADFDGLLKIRAYDIQYPKIYNNRKIVLNDTLDASIITDNYVITRSKDDYIITFRITLDTSSIMLNTSSLKTQLTFTIPNTNIIYSYIGDVLEDDDGLYGKVTINTSGYIDDTDKLILINFISDVSTGQIDLVNDGYVLIYSTDNSTSVNKTSLNDYLVDVNGVAVLYKESITIELAKRLSYLFTNYNLEYTDRKYKTYTDNVYLTYKENVYEVDDTGTPVYTPVDTDGDGVDDDVTLTVLHNAGDQVLDSSGNPIILHKAGDVILDDAGNPVIDYQNGLVHILDILMLEYQLLLANNTDYINYRSSLYNKITDICTDELADINTRLLENTRIRYKPNNNLKDVNLIVNDIVYSSKNFVEPQITVYVVDTIVTTDLVSLFENTVIGNLQYLIRNYNRVSDMENTLASMLGENVVSVRIRDLDTIGDVDIKNYTTNSSRIVVAKKLSINNIGSVILDLNTSVDIVSL